MRFTSQAGTRTEGRTSEAIDSGNRTPHRLFIRTPLYIILRITRETSIIRQRLEDGGRDDEEAMLLLFDPLYDGFCHADDCVARQVRADGEV